MHVFVLVNSHKVVYTITPLIFVRDLVLHVCKCVLLLFFFSLLGVLEFVLMRVEVDCVQSG